MVQGRVNAHPTAAIGRFLAGVGKDLKVQDAVEQFTLVWSVPQLACFLLDVLVVGRDEEATKMVRGVECGCDMRLQPRAAELPESFQEGPG